MKDLKTLVIKLLEQKPNSCIIDGFMCAAHVSYVNGDTRYEISLHKASKYSLELHIYSVCDSKSYYYDCDLSEQEFMEIKWKIEGWDQVLQEDVFNAFSEYVESLPGDARDELLND